MSARAAIVIGVDRVGNMPVLNAANGAIDFDHWARAQGITSTLLTDSKKPVLASEIFAEIKKLVESRSCQQLIVFYSGHGVYRGPYNEFWLLSDAEANPNEAVNVTDSMFNARQSGIDHIVLISDACRVLPELGWQASVRGSTIFPAAGFEVDPKLDWLSSCRLGQASYEVKLEHATAYVGLYTTALMTALNGDEDSVLEPTGPRESIVTSWTLADWLKSDVPKRAAAVSPAIRQRPQAIVESRPPSYLSKVAIEAEVFAPIEAELSLGIATSLVSSTPLLVFEAAVGQATLSESKREDGLETLGTARRFAEAKARESFETETGFTVNGSRVLGVLTLGVINHHSLYGLVHPGDVFKNEQGAEETHIRVHPVAPLASTLAVKHEHGYTFLPILKGYIGSLLFEEGLLVSISYSPSANNPRYFDVTPGISEARSLVVAAAVRGEFGPSREEAKALGDFLRYNKAFDPVLGLFAMYAYASAGYFDQMRSVLSFMRTDLGYAQIFDVLLLAEKAGEQNVDFDQAAVPFCPMLTQGWSYLGNRREAMPHFLQDADRYLVPGLWTSFSSNLLEVIPWSEDQWIL